MLLDVEYVKHYFHIKINVVLLQFERETLKGLLWILGFQRYMVSAQARQPWPLPFGVSVREMPELINLLTAKTYSKHTFTSSEVRYIFIICQLDCFLSGCCAQENAG